MKRQSAHPGPGTLLDFREGRLEEEAAAPVRSHLARCPRCRGLLIQLEKLTGAIPGPHLERTPAWLAAWADDVPRLEPRPKPEKGREGLALVFDSWQALPMAARSIAPAPRRLVFRSGPHDVDLEMEMLSPGLVRLHGQVLDSGPVGDYEGGVVRIICGKRTLARTSMDRDGRFRFDRFPRRKGCSLLIEGPGLGLELTDLGL